MKQLISFILCAMLVVSLCTAALASGEPADTTDSCAASSELMMLPDGEALPNSDGFGGAPASGEIVGTDLSWTVSEDGVLTVTGTDAIPDYHAIEEEAKQLSFDSPWFPLRDSIVKIEVTGAQAIGENAFRNLSYAEEAVLGEGVEALGDQAFFGCLALAAVELPETLASIGAYCFAWCPLTHIDFPAGLKSIGAGCFE